MSAPIGRKRWAIADGYYLYRHRMGARVESGFKTNPLQLPAGRKHTDEFFGEVETYRGRVTGVLTGAVDPDSGWVVDFFDVEAIFAPVLERLDHYCLNEVEGLENPTAENIAAWIWQRVRPGLPGLSSVRVFETPMSWAEFEG